MADIYAKTMPRDQTESQRLDEQFDLLTRNIGYLLHPSIARGLSCSPTIADIGTGTGNFLSQLAELYPMATLRGFDISQNMFPAPDELPTNVELSVMDIKKLPPAVEHNRYDVVHIRLLTAVMNVDDWALALDNVLSLLKPGGALQWEECNFADVRHLRGHANSSVTAARFMGSLFRESLKDKFSYGWSTLPQLMKNAGLMHVDEDIVSSDRIVETRQALTTNGMRAIFAWAKYMSNYEAPGSLAMHEIEELEAHAEKDIRSGCYVRYDIHITIGFRQA